MNRFDLICIDMFQTLVDVDTRVSFLWKRILKDKYNEQLKEECVKLVDTIVINKFHENITERRDFMNLTSLFTPCFFEITKKIGVDFDPHEAVEIFIEEHGKAESFEDSTIFFERIGDLLPICLVSDADNEMVLPHLKKFKFDKTFISEDIKSYKNEPESKIFIEVLKQYSIDPQKVIHIGDSSSDILGAKKNGITTCWINRNGHHWRNNIGPDYIVNSLIDVIDILGLETKGIVINN